MSDEPKATRGRKRRSPRPPGSNRTDAEMEESEERYRILVGALQEGALLQMADGSIAVCNPSAARILGLPSDQMIRGRASFDTLSPAIREDGSPLPRDDHPAITALRTGKPVTGAIMGVQRANGESVWISVSAQPLFHRGEAHPYGVVTSFFDVTERKRIEQALRVSEDLYRDLVEHAKALICIHDLEGRLLAVNEAAEKNLGYDRHMHLGREIVTIRDLMAPETRPGFERYLETIRTAGAADGVMAVQTRKGEKRYWEYHNSLRSEGVVHLEAGAAFLPSRLRPTSSLAPCAMFSATDATSMA